VALVRILIDGYSLLHAWAGLAENFARHSAKAREELVYWITQYHDAVGTPITIFFDGGNAAPGTPDAGSNVGVEVLYSKKGQTADDLIERTTHRLRAYGEVLVVTNDHAERDTVVSLGGMVSSCENFVRDVQSALGELGREVKRHNQREKGRFNRPHRV